ncbi:MAG: hypothetical protein EAZ91_21745 [Cytophagales bacterium]|nr:MAG: hypothetical protein EAZ91_21745 [Cytophagales bacterium]
MKSLFFSQLTFILLLLTLLSGPLLAQQTYALKPYAITLPRLTTDQQNTSAPQQAGNVVFNTDEQKMAVHNGSSWQYVNTNPPGADQFRNEKAFFETQLWTVPAGVTRILTEVWGGGQGGNYYRFVNGGLLLAKGGNAGAYARGFMAVTPGTTLTLTVGTGGQRAADNYEPGSGGETWVQSATSFIRARGGATNGGNTANYFIYGDAVGFGVSGSDGTDVTISYGQQSATNYILLVKCGDGGTAYGAQRSGVGEQFSSLNSSALLYRTGSGGKGSFPGGGGGAGYIIGGEGAPGLITLRW